MPLGVVGEGQYNLVFTTLPTGLGYKLGDLIYPAVATGNGILYNGNAVQLFQVAASSTCPANGSFQLFGGATTFQIAATSAINQLVIGINDLSGSALTAAQYFFGTISGYTSVLEAASVAANTVIVSSTTAGTLAAAVAGTSLQANIQSQVASGAGGATLAYLDR